MSETNDKRIYDRCIIRVGQLEAENAKLREVIDDITEVVEASGPALVQFIAKRMERAGIELDG